MPEFDPYDHHDFGLIRVSATEYQRCRGKCCKTGGPVFQELYEEEM